MTTWLILLAGIAVVVGGIIWLRIHAFVALILGALLVAVLTPSSAVVRSQVARYWVPVLELSAATSQIQVGEDSAGTSVPERLLLLDRGPGTALRILATVPAAPPLQTSAPGEPTPSAGGWFVFQQHGESEAAHPAELPAASAVDLTALERNVSSLKVVSVTDWKSAATLAKTLPISRLTAALGKTCGSLAILIVAASIIGACLLESGGADRIVRASLAVFTERLAPLAFTVAGFVLAVPVFFDTVFLLMIPLGKSMYRRTGHNYLLYVLSILIGATMAHSLVPPTPGPLLIANELDVSVVQMAIGGCVVGGCGALGGLIFALLINRRVTLPLRDEGPIAAGTPREAADLPPLWEALLPIAVPVILIALETQSDGLARMLAAGSPAVQELLRSVLATVGDKNVALLIGAAFAVVTFQRQQSPSREKFQKTMNQAVLSAGTIILVTSAGSAFGQMLQQTSVAELLAQLPGSSPVAVVLAAFLVTTLVRTAQGSATVAMITAAGVFAPLVASGFVDLDPLYVALAIGCGSKPLSWMNDSGFLVITRTSGMTDAEGLRYVTTTMAIAALVGLVVILIGVVWFPDLPARIPS